MKKYSNNLYLWTFKCKMLFMQFIYLKSNSLNYHCFENLRPISIFLKIHDFFCNFEFRSIFDSESFSLNLNISFSDVEKISVFRHWLLKNSQRSHRKSIVLFHSQLNFQTQLFRFYERRVFPWNVDCHNFILLNIFIKSIYLVTRMNLNLKNLEIRS